MPAFAALMPSSGSASMTASDVSSLSSEALGQDDTQTQPVQLDETTRAPRTSLLRRLSTISFGGGGGATSLQEQESIDSTHAYHGHNPAYHTGDLDFFGTAQIQRQATRTTIKEDDMEEFPRIYDGGDQARDNASISSDPPPPTNIGAPLRRRTSVLMAIQSITKKLGFWDKEFHADRIKLVVTFSSNYVYLVMGFVIALSIYWGAYYDRASRYKDLDFLVVLGETPQGNVPPILTELAHNFFFETPPVRALGKFHFMNHTAISELAQTHNHSITSEVYRQIHHQKYWGAFYIRENATLAYYTALSLALTTFNPSDLLMEVVFETGRDFNAVNNYILTIIGNIVTAFHKFVPQTPYLGLMLSLLTNDQLNNVIDNAPHLLTSLPTFTFNDRIPVTNQIFTGIMTIALIYLVIFSFFQLIFLLSIHKFLASKITGLKFIALRMTVSQIAYLILSLSLVTLNTAFQIPFNVTFGHLGFLVIWMFGYLTMSSLGSLIEALALILFMLKPQMVGVILLFVAVTNVSPVISPIVLCPNFYRYGYAIPVYQTYHLMHVAYFNAWKGRVGLHIGILWAWIVCTNTVLPFVITWMGRRMKETAMKNAAAELAKADKPQSFEEKRTSQDEAMVQAQVDNLERRAEYTRSVT